MVAALPLPAPCLLSRDAVVASTGRVGGQGDGATGSK